MTIEAAAMEESAADRTLREARRIRDEAERAAHRVEERHADTEELYKWHEESISAAH